MASILADVNAEGHLQAILRVYQGVAWREIWDGLEVGVRTFADLNLPRDASDEILWRTCQEQQLVLITGNRNAAGPESLDIVIRRFNTPRSLPVFTLANPGRVMTHRPYTERVAERLLEYLIDLDAYRGAGRIFLP